MSIMKQGPVIKKAKYRIKNEQGQYDIVYFETSADQVEETGNRVFVTPDEKGKIASSHSAIQTINGKIDIINGNDGQAGSIAKALKDAKAYADSKAGEVSGQIDPKVNAAKQELNKKIDPLVGRVDTNEASIEELRAAIAQKGSRTVVVETEEEIEGANPEPEVGDMAYVLNSKRAYIFKGLEALVPGAPAGWVVFDEITSEVDLVAYLKSEEAETLYLKKTDAEGTYLKTEKANSDFLKKVDANTTYLKTSVAESTYLKTQTAEETYFKKTDKVQENNLHDDLKGKINGKLDASAVDGKIDNKLNPVKTELNGKINNLVPAVASEQPEGKATGHVWLEVAPE